MADDRIRVAMLHGPGRPDHDGVSDYVDHLLVALAEVDVEATAVAVRPGGRGSSVRWLAATVQAAREVRRLRPDLVHVQFAPSAYRFSGLPGLLPLRLPRDIPLVTTLHEYGWWAAPGWLPARCWSPVERARLWDRETGRLVPASAAVVVTNGGHGTAVRDRTGVTPVHIPIAPNVTDHSGATSAGWRLREELGLSEGAPLLAFFGFVHPVKGLRYLIEALPELHRAYPDLRLLVVGGFTSQALPEAEARAYRAELDELARRCAVADVVTFAGHLPAERVSAALHAADMVVLPFTAGVSTKSGALLTALAHGVPTAATVPDPGDDEPHRNGAVAVIRHRRDSAAIVSAVGRLLADPVLRRRLAERGRAFVAPYSWPRVAGAHRDLYRRVLGRHGG
ncbi:Glycosyltransferase involved in cell wall bisynthesis [Micromonospora rhizosphaerae]|uniref:Glycosyltransferase involved in cell wall bisynthesis n=1 Tax=Micromonospora rhizosphaerae TaxID=568872 RepID=A0A1C6SEV8_9ACTN|nr:glycosyltransferase family 4 protein [Micromonospora rhizosphaerae]SCL28014.1 Glycosyltransferase involved in cell wall bisynthesis [Micromonospora rhizosphaerae]